MGLHTDYADCCAFFAISSRLKQIQHVDRVFNGRENEEEEQDGKAGYYSRHMGPLGRFHVN